MKLACMFLRGVLVKVSLSNGAIIFNHAILKRIIVQITGLNLVIGHTTLNCSIKESI